MVGVGQQELRGGERSEAGFGLGRPAAAVLKTPEDEVDDYLRALAEISEASGGGITDPPQTVADCRGWEDNRILDLAAAVGAFLIVSADADLTCMSPWRGPPDHRAAPVRVDDRRLPPGTQTATLREHRLLTVHAGSG